MVNVHGSLGFEVLEGIVEESKFYFLLVLLFYLGKTIHYLKFSIDTTSIEQELKIENKYNILSKIRIKDDTFCLFLLLLRSTYLFI